MAGAEPTTGQTAAATLVARAWHELGGDDALPERVVLPQRSVPLPARTDAAGLAVAAVSVASLAAAVAAGASPAQLDADRIAVAYGSERWIRIDGEPPAVWAPMSGFFPAADGWVRTHGNYPHHAAALRVGLDLDAAAGADELRARLASLTVRDACRRVERRGGLCVAVRAESPSEDADLRRAPLIDVRPLGSAATRPLPDASVDAPLRGVRILDLTRVIAGPVATRTLALLGADVLRLDPADLPEAEWQHLDTGHGKRSAVLTATSPRGRARLHELLGTADVLVTGYRPSAAARLGLDPTVVVQQHPGLVVARLSAWGFGPDDLDRRGFDSLVQAGGGIGVVEGDGSRPGALPAQALDHTAGYLLAAAVTMLVARRRTEGGSYLAQVSLRRIAAELLGMPRTTQPTPAGEVQPAGHLQTFDDVGGHTVTTAAPAVAYVGGPTRFAPPRPWGRDAPAWPPR